MAPKAEQTAAEEITGRVNAALEAEGEEPGTPEAEPGTPKPGEAPKPETVTIDGETYNLEDVRKWKSGHLMESDYTKKTMALAQERKALEAREAALTQLLDRYDAALKSMTGSTADPTDEQIEVDPRLQRLLDKRDREIKALSDKLGTLEGSLTEREQTEHQNRINEQIVTIADGTIKSLLKEKGVPDDLMDLYRDQIAMRDPDCADPVTGELSKQSIAAAIRREFAAVHERIGKHLVAAAKPNNPNLKPEPKPGTKAAAPAKPKEEARPNARPKDAFAGSQQEFMDRLNAMMSAGGAEDY